MDLMYKTILKPLYICLLVLACAGKIEDKYRGEEIVLRVGQIEFKREEYDIYISKMKERMQKNSKVDLVSKCNQSFLIDGILLAEAYTAGFQNDKDIDETVETVAKQMLIQNRGILYEKCIKERVNISQDVMEKAMKRGNTKFELEYLLFVTNKDMKQVIGYQTVLTDPEEFQKAVKICEKHPDISHNTISWDWFSTQFIDLREDIYSLEQNDVSHPLYGIDGLVIFRVNKKTKNKINNSDNQINYKALTFIEEARLSAAFDKRLHQSAKININDKIAEKVWKLIPPQEIPTLDSLLFEDLKNETIMSYKINSSNIDISVGKFIKYYNDRMIKRLISSKSLLYYYLRDMAWEAHAMKYAHELGLDQEKKFVIEKRLYKNKLVIHALIEERMKNDLNIAEDELRKYYEMNKERFNKGVYSTISILYFSTLKDAITGRKFLQKNSLKKLDKITLDNAGLNGLKKAELNKKIHHKSNQFPEKTIDRIFSAGNNTILPLSKLNDSEYIVIIKEDRTGNRYTPYSSAKKILRSELYNKKFSGAKFKLYSALSEKYEIKTSLKGLGFGTHMNSNVQ